VTLEKNRSEHFNRGSFLLHSLIATELQLLKATCFEEKLAFQRETMGTVVMEQQNAKQVILFIQI
jgi:hypothetical protein